MSADPPMEVLRAARKWAAEHRHQTPDDRLIGLAFAAGLSAGLAAGRTAAAEEARDGEHWEWLGYAHEFTITFDGDTHWVECDFCSAPVKSVEAGDSLEETVTKARDHWRTCGAARVAENGADR